jgi:hypothetical protein
MQMCGCANYGGVTDWYADTQMKSKIMESFGTPMPLSINSLSVPLLGASLFKTLWNAHKSGQF